MKQTIVIAAAFCLAPLSASAVWWAGFEWQIASKQQPPKAIIVGSQIQFIYDAVPGSQNWYWACTGPTTITDIDFSAAVAKLSGTAAFSHGIAWGIELGNSDEPNWPNSFRFQIGNASYCVIKRAKGRETFTLPWTSSSAIKRGLNQWNVLRVRRVGPTHTLWINGVQVNQFTDPDLPYGQFGFKSNDEGQCVHAFQSMSVSYHALAAARHWREYR